VHNTTLTDITIQSVAQSSAVTQGLVGWSLTALSAQKKLYRALVA